MNKSAHSPGPWRVYPSGTSAPGYHVHTRIVSDAFTDRAESDGPTEADLRLIAAAPKLLAAAKRALNLAEGYIETPKNVRNALAAAIAQAEGLTL